MLRISLFICISLISGVTPKPYKPWNKLSDAALQDTVMSDDKGKISWDVEVEPPEDMDETDYDIDPRMTIWSNMNGADTQSKQAEADLDELYHPSMADLLKAQNFNLAADIQEEPVHEDAIVKNNEQPEEDKDDIDHPDFIEVDPNEPEQDWDDVYHKAVEEQGEYLAPVEMELLQREARDKIPIRVHLDPEEDMDDLYHKELPQPIPYHYVAEAAPPAELSLQKYSEPEEDLDGIYHQ